MATMSVFGHSVRLVLRAGRRLPAILAGLYLLTGVVLAVELLIIRAVVDELDEGGSIGAGTVLRFAAVVAVGRLSPALAHLPGVAGAVPRRSESASLSRSGCR